MTYASSNAIVPYFPPTPQVPAPHQLQFGQGLFRQFESDRYNRLSRTPVHGDTFNYSSTNAGVEGDSKKFGVGKALKYMLYGLTGFFIGKFINNRLGIFNNFTFKNFLKFSALGLGGFHLGKYLLNKFKPTQA